MNRDRGRGGGEERSSVNKKILVIYIDKEGDMEEIIFGFDRHFSK